jgi:hypothetical protein
MNETAEAEAIAVMLLKTAQLHTAKEVVVLADSQEGEVAAETTVSGLAGEGVPRTCAWRLHRC